MRQKSNRVLVSMIVSLALALPLAGLSLAMAQNAAAPVAALHRGDCDNPEGGPIADLGAFVPYGTAEGEETGQFRGAHPDVESVLSAWTTLDFPFDDVLSEQQPLSITIHESATAFETVLACGEVAGNESDGRVAMGIQPMSEPGHAGVAFIDRDDAGFLGLGEDQTQVSIYLVRVAEMVPVATPVPDEEVAEEVATPVEEEEATPVEEAATPAEEEEAAPEEEEAAEEDEEAAAEEVTVEAVDIDFNPNEFSIPANTDVTVTLTNSGAIEHTFTIDELDIDEAVGPGETVEFTINAEPGEYVYYCTVPGHRESGQEGTMTVE